MTRRYDPDDHDPAALTVADQRAAGCATSTWPAAELEAAPDRHRDDADGAWS
ncbi:hypothetical protein G6O69_19120 [Pseudenhygromyxa sp. WMMC2535]|uniref:hypothetical protein n=1 Tax=Pseudenhygromyxa sp. WMMC2535 TaxID=2712867 RepID=UPI00155779C7|nr:hypothetical protein [Pseudenhygromyxa sp. WMMC2535]NVB39964.1 hypothetical protein [Pseudenhygromyxa sp. WMMC2535]